MDNQDRYDALVSKNQELLTEISMYQDKLEQAEMELLELDRYINEDITEITSEILKTLSIVNDSYLNE